MTIKRAAEIANDCNEDITDHLTKEELIEAVKFWSLQAADKATAAIASEMTKGFDRFFKLTDDLIAKVDKP